MIAAFRSKDDEATDRLATTVARWIGANRSFAFLAFIALLRSRSSTLKFFF
jgi:hypothetical protein